MPEHARSQIRLKAEIAPRHLTVVECRAPWREEGGPEWTRYPIARFHYTKATGLWSLYWRDRHLKFHSYDGTPPTEDVQVLLAEVEHDPNHLFWG